jgi:glycosyltransferase involved in cell wall biosynthesis
MLVGVCDFPSDYAFPPTGYGGIERWLWAAAVGARRAGAAVHLLGPRWRAELADHWTLRPVRLEDLSPHDHAADALRGDGYDLLVVGHEYPSLPAWRAVADAVGAQIATFQHSSTFAHRPAAFDGSRSRLYTYSDEMRARYAAHQPIQELAVHLGLGEPEPPARPGDGLLWLGRIDDEKAPHLAIRAAALLGRRITLAGPIFDSHYFDRYRDLFTAPHVTLAGEIGGKAKSYLLANARALVYTCARDYVEAGAATFGESLCAGTPVAALAWRPGTCAQSALCADSGAVALVDPDVDDEMTARALARAAEHAATLKAADVQDIGVARFDPERHFHVLAAARPC